MKGKKVRIQLNTPINLQSPEDFNKEKLRTEACFCLQGTLGEWRDAGIEIEAQEFFNERGHKITTTQVALFLPFHKIDHILDL